MRPGEYLALRRYAAGLDQATLQYDFDNVCARNDLCGRVRSIAAIEAGDGDLTALEVSSLSVIFDFDLDVLFFLVRGPAEQRMGDGLICRVCGCSWDNPCDPPCAWAEGGCDCDTTALCTECVGREG